MEAVLEMLNSPETVNKEEALARFKRAHFSGVEEMRTNDDLFQRVVRIVGPDLSMACQYKYLPGPPLEIPVTTFDGLMDNTIDPGAPHFFAQKYYVVTLCAVG